MEKKCAKCGEIKQATEFYPIAKTQNKDGLRSECKSCGAAYQKQNRIKHKQHFKQWYKENRIKNRTKREIYSKKSDLRIERRYSRWMSKAKVRKIPWELDLSFIKSLPLICHYTGENLTLERGHRNTISLDRVDNKRGYTKDNVVLCCAIVNYMKLNMTVARLKDRCRKVYYPSDKGENFDIGENEIKYIGIIIRCRKSVSKYNGREFEIDLDFILSLPKYCYYTGDRLEFRPNNYNTISLDRKDNDKGYTKDNVVLCCKDINLMKRDLSELEFKDWCTKIIKTSTRL